MMRSSTVTVRVNLAPTVTIAATGPPPRVGEPVSLGALVGTTEVTHTYRIAGTFDVLATATDTADETASAVTVLVVDDAAPLNVTVTAAPPTPQVGTPVHVHGDRDAADGHPGDRPLRVELRRRKPRGDHGEHHEPRVRPRGAPRGSRYARWNRTDGAAWRGSRSTSARGRRSTST